VDVQLVRPELPARVTEASILGVDGRENVNATFKRSEAHCRNGIYVGLSTDRQERG